MFLRNAVSYPPVGQQGVLTQKTVATALTLYQPHRSLGSNCLLNTRSRLFTHLSYRLLSQPISADAVTIAGLFIPLSPVLPVVPMAQAGEIVLIRAAAAGRRHCAPPP